MHDLTPIISTASMCRIPRIIPNSEAIFDPHFTANITKMLEDENSNKRISRVTKPTVHLGFQGLSIFSLMWIVITAQIKNEINKTIPIELTPNFSISFMYWRKNIRILSGLPKVRHISIIYRPTVFNALIICCIFVCKCKLFQLIFAICVAK